MPVMQCEKNGKSGHKWGEEGVCFIGPDSAAKAAAVGAAIKADSMTEYRYDAGGTVAARLDDNGYLRVDGVAAKAGVLTYLLPDGTIRREYVPAETLFNADSLAGLAGVPVTIEHPGIVTAETAAQYSKGSVSGEPKADGNNLKVGIVLTNADAIQSVQSGKRQLSPGYKAELDYTPGEYEGVKYDAVQTRRVYNHLAVVQSARGGPECRLNLDGLNCAVEVPNQPTEVKSMATVQLKSGATVEVADASTASTIQNELNALQARADAADNMVEKAKYDELQGKYDALMEKMNKEPEEKQDADQLGAFIETVEQARKLKTDLEIKQDGKYLTPEQIMASAIGIDAKDKSPEYIKGRFDAAIELGKAKSVAEQRSDGQTVERTLTGREKFIQEQLSRGNK